MINKKVQGVLEFKAHNLGGVAGGDGRCDDQTSTKSGRPIQSTPAWIHSPLFAIM
jgi:hypothetical protein